MLDAAPQWSGAVIQHAQVPRGRDRDAEEEGKIGVAERDASEKNSSYLRANSFNNIDQHQRSIAQPARRRHF